MSFCHLTRDSQQSLSAGKRRTELHAALQHQPLTRQSLGRTPQNIRQLKANPSEKQKGWGGGSKFLTKEGPFGTAPFSLPRQEGEWSRCSREFQWPVPMCPLPRGRLLPTAPVPLPSLPSPMAHSGAAWRRRQREEWSLGMALCSQSAELLLQTSIPCLSKRVYADQD